MSESVFYESGKHRIEVQYLGEDLWLCHCAEYRESPVFDGVSFGSARGPFFDLEECLEDAAAELLGVDDADFAVSKDQRTPVRP